MSTHTGTKRREVENVSSRVKKTKQEIEQLKLELENLIQSGSLVSTSKPSPAKEVETLELSPTKHSETANNESKFSPRNKIESQTKVKSAKNNSAERSRNYNVAEAREYMKKQKEKRALEIKAQLNVVDNRLDLKKQRLQELHQKTMELLHKNVQLKRERPKSTERAAPIRLDKTLRGGTVKPPRAVQNQNIRAASCSRVKSQVRQLSSVPSSSRARSQEREPLPRQKPTNSNKIPQETSARVGRSRTRPAEQPPPGIPDNNYLHPPDTKIDFEKTMMPPLQKTEPDNLPNQPTIVSNGDIESTDLNIGLPQNQKKVEHSIMADACKKDSKETQTSQGRTQPTSWLRLTAQASYPYNFINTVKRKLQETVGSVDVGVQHSSGTLNQTPEVAAKSKNEIKQLLINSAKSELRSFVSHRRPNLDLQVVENLELFPKPKGMNLEFVSRKLFTQDDSESDTSKNIPDISSESVPSSINPKLSLDKLKELRLQAPEHKSSDANGYPEYVNDSYSSDFSKNSFDTKSSSDKSGSEGDVSENFVTSSRSLKKHAAASRWSGRSGSGDSQFTLQSLLTEGQISNMQLSSGISNGDGSLVLQKPTTSPRIISSRPVASTVIGSPASLHSDAQKTMSLTDKNATESVPEVLTFGSREQITTFENSLNEHISHEVSGRSLSLNEPTVTLSRRLEQNIRNDRMKNITVRRNAPTNLTESLSSKSSSIRSVPEVMSLSSADQVAKPMNSVDQVAKPLSYKISGSSLKVVTNEEEGTPSLREPTIGDRVITQEEKASEFIKNRTKNITLRPVISTNNNINEIHLKFEAEVRLLNDFNESYRQFVAVEKAFESLKNKNDNNFPTKICQNVDTQTSVIAKTSTNVTTTEQSSRSRQSPSINYSRPSELVEDINDTIITSHNTSKSFHNSTLSTEWNLSNFNASSNMSVSTISEAKSKLSVSNTENFDEKSSAGLLCLNIYDQLIKDEDVKIDQLKAIIKIRQQALLDRAKGELVWLEIQKKQLIETGRVEEASLLKKKQRGIILKHEQERNEIRKLKQMQKETSEQRKNNLKRQRNLIKTQLSTEKMLSKIKVHKRKERRSSGPLKVVQSCSESIYSETPISLWSSGMDEVLSVTSKSVRMSEQCDGFTHKHAEGTRAPVAHVKKTLLMREAALERRRKQAEELLRWHRNLLDKEKRVSELEAEATSVIRPERRDRHKFSGQQLNQLWKNMTGRDERKFAEGKVYTMSQTALERLCKSARGHNKKTPPKNSGESSEVGTEVNYSSFFDPESPKDIEDKTRSISELIDNFSRVEDEISSLSRKSEFDINFLKEYNSPETAQKPVIASKNADKSAIITPNEPPEYVEDIVSSISKTVSEESSTSQSESNVVTEVEPVSEKEYSAQTAEEFISKIATESKNESSILEVPSEETHAGHSSILEEPFSERVGFFREAAASVETETSKDSATSEAIFVQDAETAKEYSSFTTTSEKIVVASQTDSNIRETYLESKASVDPHTASLTEEISEGMEEEVRKETENSEISEDPAELVSRETSSKICSEETNAVETPEETSSQVLSEETSSQVVSEEASLIVRSEKSIDSKISVVEPLALEEALESASRIEESLNRINEKLNRNKASQEVEEVSTLNEVVSLEDANSEDTSVSQSKSAIFASEEEENSNQKSPNHVSVKQRVSEILADASGHANIGDESPRLQDFYVTAYDVTPAATTDIFDNEAEELWRKQLAIEQEIKQLQLQQTEQLPYVFMREIPNKPPPPYTPPSSLSSVSQSILPSDPKEINEIASYSSKVLFKAYQNDNLDKVKFSENGFKLFSNIETTKGYAEFLFNICRDIARNHYNQFDKVQQPSWMTPAKIPQRPSDTKNLEKMFNRKLQELFGFKKAQVTESAIIKWGRKKRDHVDEILVVESQEEESQWTSFDSNELIVKDKVTNDIMNMLLNETADIFVKILAKKNARTGVQV